MKADFRKHFIANLKGIKDKALADEIPSLAQAFSLAPVREN
jgi:hypothetical protein